MRRVSWGAAVFATGIFISGQQAVAHTVLVEQAFKDVPADHWAAPAVAKVAIMRSLMRGYPDDTFRGELRFTRAQLAASLKTLIDDLERASRTSWNTGSPARLEFKDVPTTHVDRELILTLANVYHLWDRVPGVGPDLFHPDETVTRSEVAQVVKNLLESGEKRGVVLARDPRDPTDRFKDLTPAEWAYKAILADDQRYGVMIGFPDITFRPREHLTRFQFAAVGASTFEIIHELVRKTAVERELLADPRPKTRFQEARPWAFALVPGAAFGPATSAMNVNGSVRHVGYPGSWFWTAALRAGASPGVADGTGTGVSLTAGAFPQIPVLPLGRIGELQLQPYAGARLIGDGRIGGAIGLPVVGGVAYWHRNRWGVYVRGDANFLVVGGSGTTLDPGGVLGVGTEYALSDKLAVTGGLGFNKLPSGVAIGPSVGLNLAL